VIERRFGRARGTAFAALAHARWPRTVTMRRFTDRADRAILGSRADAAVAWALLSGRDLSAVIGPGQLGRLIDGMAARLAAKGAAIRRDRLNFQSLR